MSQKVRNLINQSINSSTRLCFNLLFNINILKLVGCLTFGCKRSSIDNHFFFIMLHSNTLHTKYKLSQMQCPNIDPIHKNSIFVFFFNSRNEVAFQIFLLSFCSFYLEAIISNQTGAQLPK